MPNVEHSFVLYALLLEPGGCLRAHITLFELVEPEREKKRFSAMTNVVTPGLAVTYIRSTGEQAHATVIVPQKGLLGESDTCFCMN